MAKEINKYDVLIVGSGIGGLICGSFLAKEGKKVCVLEKHDKIGGNLQVFQRNGCKFTAGMHYAGSLDNGQLMHKIYNYLGIYNDLELEKLDEKCYDKIVIGDKEFCYAMGTENFKANLINYFPNEKKAIDQYVDKLTEIWESSDLLNLRPLKKEGIQNFDRYEQNAHDYIDSLTDNKELKAVLAGTNGLYIGNKYKTPLYVHSVINYFFINSAYRIGESGASIAKLLANVVENNGGVVLTRKKVTSFEFEGQRIVSAKTENGETYEARDFISGIHPNATFKLVEPGKLRKVYINRIRALENSMSVFALFIVLNKNTFKHINSNIYYSETEDVWGNYEYQEHEWPKGFMVYTTRDQNNRGYAESVVVLTMMKFEDVAEWENTIIERRGKRYIDFKKQKEQKLLAKVYRALPDLQTSIRKVYSSTPLTYRDYTGTYKGSMYGIIKDCNNPLETFLPSRTKIPNLFLAGQNIGIHGMLGVVMSSFQTCSAFIDINSLILKIKNEEDQKNI